MHQSLWLPVSILCLQALCLIGALVAAFGLFPAPRQKKPSVAARLSATVGFVVLALSPLPRFLPTDPIFRQGKRLLVAATESFGYTIEVYQFPAMASPHTYGTFVAMNGHSRHGEIWVGLDDPKIWRASFIEGTDALTIKRGILGLDIDLDFAAEEASLGMARLEFPPRILPAP